MDPTHRATRHPVGPDGHDVLLDVLRRSPAGDLTPLLDDADQVRMLGSFPMPRLAAMLGPALGEELDRALQDMAPGAGSTAATTLR